MIRIIFLSLLLVFMKLPAQGTVGMPTTQGFLEKLFIDGLGTSVKYSDINGSAYTNKNFKPANAAKNYATMDARYNSYADQIEFQQNKQIFVLPKDNKFSRIEFLDSNEVLVLLNLNGKEGYAFELFSGNNKALLRKVITKLNVPEKSKNSYASDDTTPSFVTTSHYYIGLGDKFIEVPSRRKRIFDQFPEQKKELEAKVKTNNIDINTDKGLIDFVKLL